MSWISLPGVGNLVTGLERSVTGAGAGNTSAVPRLPAETEHKECFVTVSNSNTE